MNTKRQFWLTRIIAVAALLSLAAACGDDATGPRFLLTPESTADVMEQVVAEYFEGNEAATSFEALGASILAALGGGIQTAAFESTPRVDSEGGIADHLLSIPAHRAAANIPDIFEGVTFEWDEQLNEYTPGERTGAPTNGARFILYAVERITELPITPLTEIGYLDISDASAWPSIDITVEAVIGTVTMLYADMTGNWGETNAWLDIDGYLSDGSDQLSFGVYAEEDMAGSSLEFVLGYGNFEATYVLSQSETAESAQVTFSDGTNTLVFSLALEGQFIDQVWVDVILEGSGITFNGEPVAVIAGWIGSDEVQITITNAAGDPLTATELAALEASFVALEGLGDLMIGFGQFAVEVAWLSAR